MLGAGASAFDNAAEALEAGAAQVLMFARRPILPQVNKSKWTAFAGFQHGYASLDDARRWRFYTYIFSEQVPPPYESVLRCERHPGFSIAVRRKLARPRAGAGRGRRQGLARFDAVIVGTGFDVNLMDRPEIAPSAMPSNLARSCIARQRRSDFPRRLAFPISAALQFTAARPGVGRVHVFNWGSTMSHGALAGDIPAWRSARTPARPTSRAICSSRTRSATGSAADAQRGH